MYLIQFLNQIHQNLYRPNFLLCIKPKTVLFIVFSLSKKFLLTIVIQMFSLIKVGQQGLKMKDIFIVLVS